MARLPIPTWTNDYIRIPFVDRGRTREGADCWGLPRIIYKERQNIDLPTLDGYEDVREKQAIAALYRDEAKKWIKVEDGLEITYDILVFNIRGLPSHIGLVVRHGTMIHCEKGRNTCLVEYRTDPEWNTRLVGIYRYAEGQNLPTPVQIA